MKRKKEVANPFVHARALAPEEAIGRRTEVDSLLRRAIGGHNVTLHGPRRTGKTSLLTQLAGAAERTRMPVVRVDLSDVLSPADVAIRLEQSLRALPGKLSRAVGRELGGIGLTTPLGGVNVQRRPPGADAVGAIHSLLDVPARLAERTDRRVLVILDEFQALIALEGLDGVFRSHLQHHQKVSYVFCGSEPSLLRALFEDRARPLFGQAEQMRLERLDFAAAHDFIARRFGETGRDSGEITPELVRLSEGHAQRLMLLAHQLWEQVGSTPATISDLRVAYDVALRSVDTELRYLWEGLTANERRVLRTAGSGISPYTAEARAMTGLASASSAQRAVRTLRGRAIVEEVGADEDLRLVDPLLSRWVRRHGGARIGVYVVPRGNRGFVVTDGPSFAFTRSEHATLEEAETEADRIAAAGSGSDVMIYDTVDPNDLPEWAIAE